MILGNLKLTPTGAHLEKLIWQNNSHTVTKENILPNFELVNQLSYFILVKIWASFTDVFRTQSNIYDGFFFENSWRHFSQKSSIIDVRLGSKYASGIFCGSESILKSLTYKYCQNTGNKNDIDMKLDQRIKITIEISKISTNDVTTPTRLLLAWS